MIFELGPLFMSGPFLMMGAIVYYFIGGIDSYYRKYGRLGKGRIIAFKQQTTTRSVGDGSRSKVTTVCPVIKFYNNGEEVIFVGTNQNYLYEEIGAETEVYYLPGKKNYVIQKKNSFKIAKLIGLIFIVIAFTLIYTRDTELPYKVLIPLLSCSFFSLFLLKIKKTMKKRALKEGKTGNLLQLIWDQILPNENIIDHKELDEGEGFIRSSTEFDLKKSKANLFGVLFSLAVLVVLNFLIWNVYTNRTTPQEKAIIDRFIHSPDNLQEILNQSQSNSEISSILILLGFILIFSFGFLINLKGWLRNR